MVRDSHPPRRPDPRLEIEHPAARLLFEALRLLQRRAEKKLDRLRLQACGEEQALVVGRVVAEALGRGEAGAAHFLFPQPPALSRPPIHSGPVAVVDPRFARCCEKALRWRKEGVGVHSLNAFMMPQRSQR